MVIPTQESPYLFNRAWSCLYKIKDLVQFGKCQSCDRIGTSIIYGNPASGFFVEGSTREGFVRYVPNTLIIFLRRKRVWILISRFFYCRSETCLRTCLETKLQRYWKCCSMGDGSYLCWILQNSWLATKNMYNDNKFWERSQNNIEQVLFMGAFFDKSYLNSNNCWERYH